MKQEGEILSTRQRDGAGSRLIGLARKTDCFLSGDHPEVLLSQNDFDTARSVFVNMRCPLKSLRLLMEALPKFRAPKVDVVLAGEDWTFPNGVDIRFDDGGWYPRPLVEHPKLGRLFVENLDAYLGPTVESLPTGLVGNWWHDGDSPHGGALTFKYFRRHENLNPSRLVRVTNWNKARLPRKHWEDRNLLNDLSKTDSWRSFIAPPLHGVNPAKEETHVPYDQYLAHASTYWFMLCGKGGGLDLNPKLFEALLVGTIPIIKRCPPLTDVYEDWPVAIVDEWDEGAITYDVLCAWQKQYAKHFTDTAKRETVLRRLSLDYWAERITRCEDKHRLN